MPVKQWVSIKIKKATNCHELARIFWSKGSIVNVFNYLFVNIRVNSWLKKIVSICG